MQTKGTYMTTLLGISGSLRKESTNTKLIRAAAEIFAPDTFVEADLNLPLYNGDLESASGIPQSVQTLADQITNADAVIISTPEYNKAPSGVLKNALDWVSRTKGGPWNGKPVAIMSAAAGRAGGERAQFALRLMMTPFRPDILQGPEMMLANSAMAFDEDGKLADEFAVKLLTELMETLKARI
jgi:chromate reductase